jgi:polar amino acid transport system substrate-binding protein
LLALGVPAFAQGGAPGECRMRLRWYDDAPYFMRGPQGEVQGIQADLVTEALRRMGCQVSLVELPWARALVELQAGRVDVVAGALRRPEREAYAYFAQPRLRSPNVLFAHVEAPLDPAWRRLTEVARSPFRLGAQGGVSYGPDFLELMADPAFASRIVRSALRRNLWTMIGLRRLDGIVADQATGRYELRQLGLSDRIRETAVVVSTEASTIMFAKKTVSADFVRQYDQISEAMVKNGTEAAIVARYLGSMGAMSIVDDGEVRTARPGN